MQLAGRAATALLSAAAFVLLGRHLDDPALGVFNFHFTLFLILGALADFGSMSIAVRESTRRPEREEAVIRAVFRLRLRLAAAGFAVYAPIAWFEARDPVRFGLLMVAALHLFATAPAAAAAWLQTRVRLTAVALAPIAGFALYFGGCVLLLAIGVREPGWFVLALAAGFSLQAIVPWAATRRRVALRGAGDPALERELLHAMLPLGVSAAVSTIYFRMDAVLLRQLVGADANGLYARAFPMLSLAIALPTYLSAALLPAMTRAAARGPGPLLVLARRSCSVLAGLVLPAAAVAWSWGAQLLWVLWARHGEGESLAAFSSANRDLVRCVPALAVAAVAIFLTYPQMHALTAMGRQRVLARISLLALGVKLAASVVAIRRFGVPGAALATALAEVGVLGWVSFELRRACGGLAPSRALLRPLLAALPAGGVAALAPDLAPLSALAAGFGLAAAGSLLSGALPLRLGVGE